VRARDGFGRKARLARRKPGRELASLAAIDEQLNPRRAMFRAQTNMIGRALIGKIGMRRQSAMDREPVFTRKDRDQRGRGVRMLKAAMQHGRQVGRCEMEPLIARVCRRRHRRGVRGPHAAGRIGSLQEPR
jgi:hypothetical protein